MAALTLNQKENWLTHIETFQASGLSMKKYCEQENIIYHQFQYHYTQHNKKPSDNTQPAPTKFSRLRFAGNPPNIQPLSLAFPNGINCTLPIDTNPAILKKIIEVILL